jgi:hypothetical protein
MITIRRLLPFLLALMLTLMKGAFAHAYGVGNYIMSVEKISLDGELYSAVTIRTRENMGLMPITLDADEEYIRDLLRIVHKWMLDQYVDQGRIEKGSQLYNDLLITESIVDERSTLIFLTEYNNLNQILATMRVATQGISRVNSLLPYEKRLLKHLTEIRQALKRPVSRLTDIRGKAVLREGFAEWKNIIKAVGLDHDVIAMLLSRAVYQDLWGIAFRRGHYNGRTWPTVPAEIILECDSNMYDHYYGRYGFRPVIYIPEDDTHIMKAEREDFLQKVDEAVSRRTGKGILSRAMIESITFRPQLSPPACSDLLNHQRPFFREIPFMR